MTKFLKLSKVTQEVNNLIGEHIKNSKSFPQVLFLPELLYRAALTLYEGDKELAFKFANSNSKLHSSALLDMLTGSLDTLSESLSPIDSSNNTLEVTLSNDSISASFRLDGHLFKERFLRTVMIYEIPEYIEGVYFGVLPTSSLEECEESEQDDAEAEGYITKKLKTDKAEACRDKKNISNVGSANP